METGSPISLSRLDYARMKRLIKLIRRGEGEQLNFKQTISDPVKIAKTIASFANTRGGTLLVGVRDNRTIRGVDPEEEKYVLETAASFHCDPAISLTYREVEDQETETIVLEVTITESKHKPHYTINQLNETLRLHSAARQKLTGQQVDD